MGYAVGMRLLVVIFLLLPSVAAADPRMEVVGRDAVDFGEYPARGKKVATYKVRNTGTGVLKILKVRKTCGCASATASKTELRPAEEAEVTVVILPNTIFGLYSKNTFVESSDPSNKFLKLNTSGHAVPLVKVTPSMSINAGRIKKNTEWRASLSLTATEPGVALGQAVATNSHPMVVKLVQTGTNAMSTYKLDLSLSPTDKSGDLRCNIALPVVTPTNHPPLNISVVGRLGTELSAVPGIAYLTLSDKPQTRKFAFRVLGARSRILRPEELIVPKHPEITCDVTRNDRQNTLEATLTFSPEFVKQLYAEETIPLLFSIPGAASSTVVCKIKK